MSRRPGAAGRSAYALATSSSGSFAGAQVTLDVAGVEPRQVLVELVDHQLLGFLAELLSQHAEKLRRGHEVQLVIAVLDARFVEKGADALGEELGIVVDGAVLVVARVSPGPIVAA